VILTVIGLVVAVFSSAEYTSSATVIREAGAEGGLGSLGGLSALRGFGLSIGGASGGLTPEAYPDILQSAEVRLAVAQDTFYFSELGRRATFVEYVEAESSVLGFIKQYTIGLPGLILSSIRENPSAGAEGARGGLQRLTETEYEALEKLSDLISTSTDLETGLMRVSITTENPVLSAALTESFVSHLTERVRTIRTRKAREDLDFIEQQFAEAEGVLQEAEEALARFDDRNNNPQTARLRTERDQLQRQVTFASQLYSDLLTQRTQAQIELQRSQPVVTVLEEAAIPLEPSGPNRKMIVLLSLVLGGALGIGLAFVKAAIEKQSDDDENSKKLELIRSAFIPKRWRNGKATHQAAEEQAHTPATP
jgi:capsular polysaccharide biosynthesis protein